MTRPQARRITRELTDEEKDRLAQHRAKIAEELPDLIARDQLRKEAAGEATLSGELRRAIHSSQTPLSAIASKTGVSIIVLDEFLTGERTLRSDVMDRLAGVLGFVLQHSS